MNQLIVELVSVEQKLWSGTAQLVTAQTLEGSIGVLYGHEPFFAALALGSVVEVVGSEGSREIFAVDGGFISVTGTEVTILAEAAEAAHQVDVSVQERILQGSAPGSEEFFSATAKLRAVERLKVYAS